METNNPPTRQVRLYREEEMLYAIQFTCNDVRHNGYGFHSMPASKARDLWENEIKPKLTEQQSVKEVVNSPTDQQIEKLAEETYSRYENMFYAKREAFIEGYKVALKNQNKEDYGPSISTPD